MPLILSRNDITKLNTDAVVVPANEQLLAGRGTSINIYKAAGMKELNDACQQIGFCPVGDAVITDGFQLCRKIIHAVGPHWQGGNHGEAELLYGAYAKALKLAFEEGLESIAFPLLSSGNYGYPKREALNVANHAISDFLMEHEMDVHLVFYDRESLAAGKLLYQDIQEYIDDNYQGFTQEFDFSKAGIPFDEEEWLANSPRKSFERAERKSFKSVARERFEDDERKISKHAEQGRILEEEKDYSGQFFETPSVEMSRKIAPELPKAEKKKSGSLKEFIGSLKKEKPETFHEMLFRLIDESGMSYPEVYHKANMSKKLFSKIKLNPDSTPKKKNIIALAIALKLDMKQTEELLMKAGYALSNSSMADVIISYFIETRNYNIFDINEALFDYGLDNDLLGF